MATLHEFQPGLTFEVDMTPRWWAGRQKHRVYAEVMATILDASGPAITGISYDVHPGRFLVRFCVEKGADAVSFVALQERVLDALDAMPH